MDRIELIEAYREIIKENIEYDLLVLRYGRERLDEALELMLEVILSIEIRVENTLIRGSVQVTKTEAVEEPSPVEKEDKKDKNSFLRFLPGAVFDLYADSNANQEYDPDDQKIGTLKETDAGYRLWSDHRELWDAPESMGQSGC